MHRGPAHDAARSPGAGILHNRGRAVERPTEASTPLANATARRYFIFERSLIDSPATMKVPYPR